MSGSTQKLRPKFTARGKQVVQWSLLMLGVGFYLKDAALLTVGMFLIVLVITCFIICWRNFRGVIIRRETPEAVFAGDEFSVFLLIKRDGRRPIFCISVKDYFLPEKKSNFLIPVAQSEWQRFGQVRMKMSKRGVYKHSKCKISSDFPLGLFSMENRIVADVNITVYPEPVLPKDDGELMKGHDKEARRSK